MYNKKKTFCQKAWELEMGKMKLRELPLTGLSPQGGWRARPLLSICHSFFLSLLSLCALLPHIFQALSVAEAPLHQCGEFLPQLYAQTSCKGMCLLLLVPPETQCENMVFLFLLTHHSLWELDRTVFFFFNWVLSS